MAILGHGVFRQHAVAAHHKNLDGFALHGVGNANGGALHHTGTKRNDVFQFRGEHVEAAHNDHVFLAIDNSEKSFFVHDAHIAGAHEAIGREGFACFFFLLVIAHHDVGAANANFTRLTLGQALAIVVFDGHFDAGQRQANGAAE